ncbi:uncharacterized protein TNCT_509721 [Trichonephila clavata]|uniref:DH domain-containing protein n=1 Tax=Trichonephila clavata TaxID=2740835 RepID=A0A8X6I4B9_TRICU|nr:uncharacterized protein TNCT_509721 [Trichonephila clavata]
MRASLSSSLLTSTSSEDSSRFNRTDKSPSKSCCGDTASDPLLSPPQNGLLFIGYCAHWDTRTHVVYEILETEKSYVESLQTLTTVSIFCRSQLIQEKKHKKPFYFSNCISVS